MSRQQTPHDAGSGDPLAMVGELAHSYRQQLEHYRALEAAAREHQAKLREGEFSAANERLQGQAKVAGQIEALEGRVRELRERLGTAIGAELPTVSDLEAWAGKASPQARDAVGELKAAVDEVAQTLQGLQALMDENRAAAEEHVQRLRGDIGRLKQGQSAFKAYAREMKSEPGGARFVDRNR